MNLNSSLNVRVIDGCCVGVCAYLLFVKNRWEEKRRKKTQRKYSYILKISAAHCAASRILLTTDDDESILKAHKRWTPNLFTICTHEQQHALQITTRHTHIWSLWTTSRILNTPRLEARLGTCHTIHGAPFASQSHVALNSRARINIFWIVVCYRDVCIVPCFAWPEPIVSRWTPFFCGARSHSLPLLTSSTDLPRVCVFVVFSLFTFCFLAVASDWQEWRQGAGERRLLAITLMLNIYALPLIVMTAKIMMPTIEFVYFILVSWALGSLLLTLSLSVYLVWGPGLSCASFSIWTMWEHIRVGRVKNTLYMAFEKKNRMQDAGDTHEKRKAKKNIWMKWTGMLCCARRAAAHLMMLMNWWHWHNDFRTKHE